MYIRFQFPWHCDNTIPKPKVVKIEISEMTPVWVDLCSNQYNYNNCAHEYYESAKYEPQTPSQSGRTRFWCFKFSRRIAYKKKTFLYHRKLITRYNQARWRMCAISGGSARWFCGERCFAGRPSDCFDAEIVSYMYRVFSMWTTGSIQRPVDGHYDLSATSWSIRGIPLVLKDRSRTSRPPGKRVIVQNRKIPIPTPLEPESSFLCFGNGENRVGNVQSQL